MSDFCTRLASTTLFWLSAVIFIFSTAEAQTETRTFSLKAENPKFWDLIDSKAQLSKVAGSFGFTEGPVWDERGFLYDRQRRLIDCASVLRAIIAVTPDGKYTILADKFEGKKFNSPNDVITGPDGAIYFTDPTLDLVKGEVQEIPFQGVYRLDDNGNVRLLTKELTQPNGLAFSPDGKRFYVDDSEQRNIRAYNVGSDGSLSNGHIFGAEPGGKHEGVPDGMRVDEAGNLYVTGPKGIWIWDPEGHHLGTIEMPEQPANLIWGDNDYRTLYITATTSVYKLRTKVRGFVPYLAQPQQKKRKSKRPATDRRVRRLSRYCLGWLRTAISDICSKSGYSSSSFGFRSCGAICCTLTRAGAIAVKYL